MEGVLVFGPLDGDRVEIGPYVAPSVSTPLRFLLADVVVWVDGSEVARRRSGNGFEAVVLLNLRADLSLLRRSGRGRATFGDHDYEPLVELEAGPDGTLAVTVSVPDADLWWLEVASLDADGIDRLIATVGSIEEEFGVLSGCIGCCGIPTPTYSDTVYPPRPS